MGTASIRLEHMMDRDGPVNRWVLACPHGRWFFDQRDGGFPTTKGAIISSVLVPNHNKEHDHACTRELSEQYGPDGPGRDDR